MDATDAVFLLALAAIVAGVAFIYWPAALIVAGVLGVVAVVALSRPKPQAKP